MSQTQTQETDFLSLSKHLGILDNPDEYDKTSIKNLEEDINLYIDSSLMYLYEVVNSKFIKKEILSRFDGPNFLALCRYFENQNKFLGIIKNNTIKCEIGSEEKKFIIFVFTINFVTFYGFNYSVKKDKYNGIQLKTIRKIKNKKISNRYYDPISIEKDYCKWDYNCYIYDEYNEYNEYGDKKDTDMYDNIFDNYLFNPENKIKNREFSEKFKETAERLVLFISLTNYKFSDYSIPFEIIMIILLENHNPLFLHY